MKRRRVLFIRLSQFRVFIRKLLVAALFVSALMFMMLSKADTLILNKITNSVSQAFSPVIKVMQFPAEVVYAVYDKVRDITLVYSENKRLKAENLDLLMLKNQVRTLKAENKLLGQMLNYTPPPEASFVTAKIVAEEGDGFSHSLIAYTDNAEQVRKGQVVLGAESVVGRVESVSGSYVRVLLFTDINSKVPVILERNRIRGILSGDNTTVPKLMFTAAGADIKEGDMVVTSGVAGVFPTGLPIGVVSKITKGAIAVETISDIERLEYIKIVDYGVYDGMLKLNQGGE
ncbi:MAG: rod shape-determining protein MreC [Alphaproteobacteria bacterium]|nr:rod shape-determining protein MreC [Alphaproteobacteria bacterium]